MRSKVKGRKTNSVEMKGGEIHELKPYEIQIQSGKQTNVRRKCEQLFIGRACNFANFPNRISRRTADAAARGKTTQRIREMHEHS